MATCQLTLPMTLPSLTLTLTLAHGNMPTNPNPNPRTFISIDAQKRRRNAYAWPYIAPAGIDGDRKVAVYCEAIATTESNLIYAHVINTLFVMTPGRMMEHIHAIFADGLLTDAVIQMTNLAPARIFRDWLHLSQKRKYFFVLL